MKIKITRKTAAGRAGRPVYRGGFTSIDAARAAMAAAAQEIRQQAWKKMGLCMVDVVESERHMAVIVQPAITLYSSVTFNLDIIE